MKVTQKAIRILLINPKNEILLLQAQHKPSEDLDERFMKTYWFTPGGRYSDGEDEVSAALRELYEETGLTKNDVEIGPIVWYGDIELVLYKQPTHLKNRFIVMRTDCTEISFENFTPEEKEVIKTSRWFSLNDIKNCKEIIYPECIVDTLPAILEGNFPEKPVHIEL